MKISVSEALRFLECPRKHFYQYTCRRLPLIKPKPLAFGIAIHIGLQEWFKSKQIDQCIFKIKESSVVGIDEFDFAAIEVMLRAYDLRWKDENIETIESEKSFEIQLAPDINIVGRMDLLCSKDKKQYVMEHKTSSMDISPGSNYWVQKQLDPQSAIYIWAARKLGFSVDGIIHDVLCKPRIQPLKATPIEKRKFTQKGFLYQGQREKDETPIEYAERIIDAMAETPENWFIRKPETRTNDEIHQTLSDLVSVAEMISTGHSPKNTGSCFNFNRPCEYFDVCANFATIDDPTRFYESVY